MASAMLKKAAAEKSKKGKSSTASLSDSETSRSNVSLPVSLPLTLVRNQSQTESDVDNIFDKFIRGTRSERSSTPNERHEENPSSDNQNMGNKIDKLADTITLMSSSISAGFDNMAASLHNYFELEDDCDDYYDDDDLYDERESASAIQPATSTPVEKITVDDLLKPKKKDENSGSEKVQNPKQSETESGKKSLLEILDEQITPKEATDSAINEKLATMVNSLMFKSDVDKKVKENAKEMCEEVKRPQNCNSLSTTKVDELIWSRLQPTSRSLDIKFQEIQNYLVKGVTIMVKLTNDLIMDKNVSTEKMVKESMKAVELITFANYELNVRRRECLKGDIDNEKYLGLFSQSVPMNEFLFGGEINKRLEDIEKANKVVDRVIRSKNFSHTPRGRRFPRYHPYSYSNRRRGRASGHFLGQRRGGGRRQQRGRRPNY